MVSRRQRCLGGFTLVELLVVIGIISVLISMLLPALNRSREQARRVACAANLKQLAAAFNMYAVENRGKLPQHYTKASGLAWLFDIPNDTREALLRYGTVRETFYCPSNADSQNVDTLWWFNTGVEATAVHSATGYQMLFRKPGIQAVPGGPVTGVVAPMNGSGPFLLYGRRYIEKFTEKQTLTIAGKTEIRTPADLELATDMTNSRAGPPEQYEGARGGHIETHRTAHIRGLIPSGGNVLFLDGHVSWKNWNDMKRQCQDGQGGGTNYFYW